MKPISGFEIVKRLAKLGFDRPVIFTSGYPAEYWAAVEGKQDLEILEKPFTAAELRAAVANAMAKTTRKPAKRKAIAATAKSRTTSMAG
jgi:FixJ family two-component response regulator